MNPFRVTVFPFGEIRWLRVTRASGLSEIGGDLDLAKQSRPSPSQMVSSCVQRRVVLTAPTLRRCPIVVPRAHMHVLAPPFSESIESMLLVSVR